MPTAPRELWLDRLPDDVSARIVSFLHLADCARSLEHAMSLAQTSAKQARAVVAAMYHSFYLDDVRDLPPAQALAWCAAAFPHVKTLCIAKKDALQDAVYRQYMLNAPLLYRLYTRPDPAVLRAISHSPTIRSLDISEDVSSTSLADNPELVFSTLASLNLTELHLDCTIFSPHDAIDDDSDEVDPSFFQQCGFVELLKHDNDPHTLGSTCPNVTTLGIRCFHNADDFDLVPFLDGFPNLREFTADFSPMCAGTGRSIPQNLVNKLRTLESVHLSYVIGGTACARDIGPPVKTLQNAMCYRYLLRDAQVLAGLSNCPNLGVLKMFIRPGVEEAFPAVAEKLLALKTLYVTWEIDCSTRALLHPTTGARYARRVAEEYHSPAPYIFLRAVNHSPKLKHLALLFVRIGIEEMTGILRKAGATLQALAVSIRGQDESPRGRVTLLLEQIAESNTELKIFDVEDIDEVTGKADQSGRDRKPRGDRKGLATGDRRLQTAFNKARRNVPMLNWSSFAQTVVKSYGLRLTSFSECRSVTSSCC